MSSTLQNAPHESNVHCEVSSLSHCGGGIAVENFSRAAAKNSVSLRSATAEASKSVWLASDRWPQSIRWLTLECLDCMVAACAGIASL